MAPTGSILCNYKKTEKAFFCPSIVVAPPYPVKFDMPFYRELYLMK